MGISPTDMLRDQPQLKVGTGDIGPNGRYKILAMTSWAQYSMAILDFMGFRMFFRMVFLFFYKVTFPDHQMIQHLPWVIMIHNPHLCGISVLAFWLVSRGLAPILNGMLELPLFSFSLGCMFLGSTSKRSDSVADGLILWFWRRLANKKGALWSMTRVIRYVMVSCSPLQKTNIFVDRSEAICWISPHGYGHISSNWMWTPRGFTDSKHE